MDHKLSTPVSLQTPFDSPELPSPQIGFNLLRSSSPMVFLNSARALPIPTVKMTKSAESSALQSLNSSPVLVNSWILVPSLSLISPSMVNRLAPSSVGRTRDRKAPLQPRQPSFRHISLRPCNRKCGCPRSRITPVTYCRSALHLQMSWGGGAEGSIWGT